MATQVNASQLKDKWQDAATQTEPDYTKLTSEGFAQDGDPIQGANATLPGAGWFNLVAAMRVSVILASGMVLSSTPDPMQYLQALQSLQWMQDGSVKTALIQDLGISTPKLADGSVTSAKLGDASVTTQKIAQKSVTTDKIADNAVGTSQLADGSVTAQKLASIDVDDLPESWLDALMPAGQYLHMAGTTLPARSMLANGALVSRTTYSRLFAAIGTKYGAGDGSTTFKLPDLNGRVLQATSDLQQVGNYLEASLPNIDGVFNVHAYATNASPENGDVNENCFGVFAGSNITVASSRVSQTNTGSYLATNLVFNANSDNATYQSGAALQVPASLCLVAIRF